jgi:hypothetical protein
MEKLRLEPSSNILEGCPASSKKTPLPQNPLSGLAKGLFLFTGVILPVLCFFIRCPCQPNWQSGCPQGYAQLFLSHAGSLPFYPLLLYNMTSMADGL